MTLQSSWPFPHGNNTSHHITFKEVKQVLSNQKSKSFPQTTPTPPVKRFPLRSPKSELSYMATFNNKTG